MWSKSPDTEGSSVLPAAITTFDLGALLFAAKMVLARAFCKKLDPLNETDLFSSMEDFGMTPDIFMPDWKEFYVDYLDPCPKTELVILGRPVLSDWLDIDIVAVALALFGAI
jgi:hypothetical protein